MRLVAAVLLIAHVVGFFVYLVMVERDAAAFIVIGLVPGVLGVAAWSRPVWGWAPCGIGVLGLPVLFFGALLVSEATVAQRVLVVVLPTAGPIIAGLLFLRVHGHL